MKAIGEISEIFRYPVKSFAGESLKTIHIESYGIYGDRFYAFVDETKSGWDSYFTAREIPAMLGYQAKLMEDLSNEGVPVVTITSQDGRSFNWDYHLLEEIQKHSKRKMSMIQNTMGYDAENLMAVDTASILIITDATLWSLEEIWGKKLDKRRFRANLVISLDDHSFTEKEWIGKRLAIGSAELQIDLFCERYSMITIDPETLERDPSLLRKVNEEMNLNFGVYASVIKTGPVHVGDKVNILD